jgi:exo-beta-1,3-glucanase (GH17 family)
MLIPIKALKQVLNLSSKIWPYCTKPASTGWSHIGVSGGELPRLAQEQGFTGLIIGIWDPTNQAEIEAAKTAAQYPIVMGYCVGNEGIHKRYEIPDLIKTIKDMKKATGKPVTTTEEIDDYVDEELLNIGDWIFPNSHPYFHNLLDPNLAVDWTKAAYQDMTRRAGNRFVLFKEVGMPTAGDKEGSLSEETQARYYQGLAKTGVKFVYFEAFDQPWKNSLPIEPHWGLFYSNRTPKQVILQMLP